jgi:hypothetical protein
MRSIARYVATLLLLGLSWAQLGSGFAPTCDAVEGGSGATGHVAASAADHTHGADGGHEHGPAPVSDGAPDSCPLIVHGASCAASIAVPSGAVVALSEAPSTTRVRLASAEAIDLLLSRSLLRPPQA